MKKAFTMTMALVLILGLLCGCVGTGDNPEQPEGPSSEEKDTLVVATNAGPADLGPHGTTDQNTNEVRYQIYEALVGVDINGGITPGLATEWVWEDDTTLTFTLREDVRFHNGNEFTAEDVLYTLEKASESSFTSAYLENILIDQCSSPEPGKVQIKLAVPVGALLSRLSMVMIIDQETWESGDEEELINNPMGTGPYTFGQFVQGDRVEFVANADYWGGEPYFKNVVLRIIPESASRALEIEAGTIDVALVMQGSDMEVLQGDSNINLHSIPCYMITYLGFDANVEPYNNPLVRQAFSYAINREALCQIAYADLATPAYGRLSEVYWGYTEEGMNQYEHNTEMAKQLLSDAGYPDGFTIELLVSEAEQDQLDIAEILLSQLGEIGVTVELRTMENASFLNTIVEGGFDAFLLNSSGSSADPGEALKSYISHRPTWSNTTRYQNEELTAMIEQGQATIDEDAKLEIFNEVQRIVNEECPWVFLVHNRTSFATRSNIEGLNAYPSTLHFFKEATLAQ